ncbi:hypothetical protein RIF29_42369 [Crotalaria pallida]|uniref:Transcription factor CBF/NF-Y/archaeal histone domain-containing protein n=1 Tax=Crotalaria pallida TaxID=3830 RepID=A0AAN9HSH7_CROPI
MTGKRNQITSSPVGSPTSGNISDSSSSKEQQDRFLPIANVSRIMKKALPANAKISKEAKETVQECVSEFISFITGEASDKCQREKRKTINGDDLLWAMTTLGFENYVGPLKVYLNNFRETEGEKSGSASSVANNNKQETGANNIIDGFNNGGFYYSTVEGLTSNYRESSMNNRGIIGQSSINNGDQDANANGNRMMAGNIRYGVEW